MVEAAELLGVEVDDFLIVGLDDELQVDESILHPSSRLDDHKVDAPSMVNDLGLDEKHKEDAPSKETVLSLKCDQCYFKTGDKWQLKIHIDAKHTGIMYDCDECQHQSAYKKNLKRHKRRAHKPLFPYNQERKDEGEWSEGEMEIKEKREYKEIEPKKEFRVTERHKSGDENLEKLKLCDPPKVLS